jgi:hypothetical protein
MTEQNNIWKVKQGSTSRKCLKHGIIVTGCTLFYDCKDCIKAEKEPKDVSKEPNKRRIKPPIPNLGDPITAKKRGRKRRNRVVSGPIHNEIPGKIPTAKSNSNVRRRTISTHQEKLLL